MSNVATVVGALVAGILGGTLFAAGLVAYPRSAAQSTATAPAGPPLGAIMTGPSGAAMVTPPGYGPGVMMTSGEPTTPTAHQSADGLVPLPRPQSAAPIPARAPTLVRYELETREVTALIDENVSYTYWTFGDTVPGPMPRVRQGDTVELTLKNAPDSKLSHSIDLHAVTGPGGWARVTTP